MEMAPLAEVAERLGVSGGHVRRLIANGELRAKKFGHSWAIDVASVNERAAAKPGRGRPLGSAAAWELLGQSEAVRLDVDDLAGLSIKVRRRAEEQRFRSLPFKLQDLRSDRNVVVSGAAGALALGSAVAVEGLDLYVRRSAVSGMVERHGLRPAVEDANVVVRVIDDAIWPFGDQRVAPLVVCALDAFERLDLRAAHEALAQAQRD